MPPKNRSPSRTGSNSNRKQRNGRSLDELEDNITNYQKEYIDKLMKKNDKQQRKNTREKSVSKLGCFIFSITVLICALFLVIVMQVNDMEADDNRMLCMLPAIGVCLTVFLLLH